MFTCITALVMFTCITALVMFTCITTHSLPTGRSRALLATRCLANAHMRSYPLPAGTSRAPPSTFCIPAMECLRKMHSIVNKTRCHGARVHKYPLYTGTSRALRSAICIKQFSDGVSCVSLLAGELAKLWKKCTAQVGAIRFLR
jgi:hypothetical protein